MAASFSALVRKTLHRSAKIINSLSGNGVRSRTEVLVCRCYSGTSDEKSRPTHFGFETVAEEEKAGRVYKVFESVAQNYDVMNDAMSLGIHRLWKDKLLRVMNPQPGLRLLDTAGGTGDISFRFLEYTRSVHELKLRRQARTNQTPSWQEITSSYSSKGAWSPETRAVVCDINREMLKVGKARAEETGLTRGLSWVVGNAEELPFDDDQFDVYTVAFGIRNVTHIEQALQEAFRVLKPGGIFLCLEFSKVSPLLSKLYDAYSFQVIPVLGEVIAGDWQSYQYLVESIRRFPNQDTFKDMIKEAGFSRVQYISLTGGIVLLPVSRQPYRVQGVPS